MDGLKSGKGLRETMLGEFYCNIYIGQQISRVLSYLNSIIYHSIFSKVLLF